YCFGSTAWAAIRTTDPLHDNGQAPETEGVLARFRRSQLRKRPAGICQRNEPAAGPRVIERSLPVVMARCGETFTAPAVGITTAPRRGPPGSVPARAR